MNSGFPEHNIQKNPEKNRNFFICFMHLINIAKINPAWQVNSFEHKENGSIQEVVWPISIDIEKLETDC